MKKISLLLIFVIASLLGCKKEEVKKEEEPEQEIINCSIQERNFPDTDITLSLEDIEVSTFTTDIEVGRFAFVSEEVGYCWGSGGSINGRNGIWKTGNGGKNWQIIYDLQDNYFLDFDFVDEQTGFVLVVGRDGRTVTLVSIKDSEVANEYFIPEVQGGGGKISFISKDIGIVDAGRGKFLSTIDAGRNWQINSGAMHREKSTQLISYQQKIYVETSEGLQISTDCGFSWNFKKHIGFVTWEMKNYGNDFYMTDRSLEGFYKTDSTFSTITKQSNEELVFFEVIDKNTIIGVGRYSILLSNDEGKTWSYKPISNNLASNGVYSVAWANSQIAYLQIYNGESNSLTKLKINK